MKRLDINSTFQTKFLLEQDLELLKGHLKDISERIYQKEKKMAIEMAYQSRLERVIRIKEIIKLEETE